MDRVLQMLISVFGIPFKPLNTLPSTFGLYLISVVMGMVLLKLFGLFSNQGKIREVKDQIKAHLLAIVIYKDDFRIGLKSQWLMLLENFRYLRYTLFPLTLSIMISIPILGQLNSRYGYQPFDVGDEIQLTVLAGKKTVLNRISIKPIPGIEIISPPMRIKDLHEVSWKLRARQPGTHSLKITVGNKDYRKAIVVGNNERLLAPYRLKSFFKTIIYPGETILPNNSELEAIQIDYAGLKMNFLVFKTHWLIPFCIVSILSGLLFKQFLRIEL